MKNDRYLLEFAVEVISIISSIGVVFPFIRLLSFLFLDNFEGNANISVSIKSGWHFLLFYR